LSYKKPGFLLRGWGRTVEGSGEGRSKTININVIKKRRVTPRPQQMDRNKSPYHKESFELEGGSDAHKKMYRERTVRGYTRGKPGWRKGKKRDSESWTDGRPEPWKNENWYSYFIERKSKSAAKRRRGGPRGNTGRLMGRESAGRGAASLLKLELEMKGDVRG